MEIGEYGVENGHLRCCNWNFAASKRSNVVHRATVIVACEFEINICGVESSIYNVQISI
jgi:hypothetical protein